MRKPDLGSIDGAIAGSLEQRQQVMISRVGYDALQRNLHRSRTTAQKSVHALSKDPETFHVGLSIVVIVHGIAFRTLRASTVVAMMCLGKEWVWGRFGGFAEAKPRSESDLGSGRAQDEDGR